MLTPRVLCNLYLFLSRLVQGRFQSAWIWVGALVVLQFDPLASRLMQKAFASDFHSPRTEALGGAGHAGPIMGDSIHLNPSFNSFFPQHSLSFSYLLYGNGQTTGPGGVTDYYGRTMNVSVLDGSPSALFQAGASYTVSERNSVIHVSASKMFLSKYSIGIGSKFILPSAPGSDRVIDGSASATAVLSSWLQVSVTGDNLLGLSNAVGFNREFVLGTRFNAMNIVYVYADPHYLELGNGVQSSFGYELGLEFPLMDAVYFRLGTFKNSRVAYQNGYGDGYGAGLGWIGPKIAFEYSFSRAITPVSALAHNCGVAIFF